MWGQREKTAIYRPRREASLETDPADTVIVQPPEPWGSESLWFQPPRLRSFVTAALEDSYILVPNASFLVYDPVPGPVHSIPFKSMTNSLGRRRKQWLPSSLPWNERLESHWFLQNSWEEGWWWAYTGNIFTCVTLLSSTFVLSKYSANLRVLQSGMQLSAQTGTWALL